MDSYLFQKQLCGCQHARETTRLMLGYSRRSSIGVKNMCIVGAHCELCGHVLLGCRFAESFLSIATQPNSRKSNLYCRFGAEISICLLVHLQVFSMQVGARDNNLVCLHVLIFWEDLR